MIDIHCHLLPGIDDGPDTLDQSLDLARRAIENGITHAVVTPHVHPGRYNNSVHSIREDVANFRQALADNDIPLKLGFAGEVRLGPEVIELATDDVIPFYGELDGMRLMLLELPHSHVPPGSNKLVSWLLDHRIRPVIAHPERNKGIMAKIDKIQPFVEMDCLFQVTAGSVAGQFGEPARQCAVQLLEMECVSVLASDAHNLKNRPPQLDHGRDAAAEIVGVEMASELVFERPRELVKSQFGDL